MKSLATIILIFTINTQLLLSQSVKINEIKTVAINFFNKINKQNNNTIKDIIPNYLDNVEVFYAINFNGGGFVLISSDKSCEPILAYSKKGIFYNIEQFDIFGIQYFLDKYSYQIYETKKNKTSNIENIEKWNILLEKNQPKDAVIIVEPLTTTFWGQNGTNDRKCGGYNFYVPDTDPTDCYCIKCPVGCGATAMAQILKYWNFAEINAYNIYDWANMPDSLLYYKKRPNINPNFNKERFAIAHLSADCGHFSKMQYCTWLSVFGGDRCQSFAWPKNLKKALKNNFGYEDVELRRRFWYSDKRWQKFITDDLNDGKPILYSAVMYDTTKSLIDTLLKGIDGGHSFILDGYEYISNINENYFHANWGWMGAYNDLWFSIDNISVGNHNYNHFERAIFNIYPTETDNSCDESLNIGDFYANGGLSDDDFPWQAIPIVKNLYSADLSYPEQYRTIHNGDDITYIAYNKIVLRLGFSVQHGGKFQAYLTDCPAKKLAKNENITDNSNNVLDHKIEKLPNLQISPNPASNTISISYFLPQETDFTIEIYDVFGKKLKQVKQGYKKKGEYQLYINLSFLQNGVYLCVLKTSQYVVSKKIVKI